MKVSWNQNLLLSWLTKHLFWTRDEKEGLDLIYERAIGVPVFSFSWIEIGALLGVSRSTLFRYCVFFSPSMDCAVL